ncbi:MAG: lamin tail domain-containing protein, partial [Polyangiaceae bacterium]
GVDGYGVPLPIFEGGVEGSTIVGDANVEAAADASDDGTASEASTDASNDGGDASASATGLVISQMQSRGTGSGNDEFIEIYNASSASITFDSTWTITVRNATGNVLTCTTVTPTLLYTGAGQVIASHEHLLLATSSYSESVTADATFSAGIPDAASLVLLQSGLVVDALCFDYDGPTTTTLTMCTMAPYVCEGTPSLNPHDNTTGTNTDASLERKPGGSGGNTVDANDNASDFQSLVTADPHDLASAAVP